MLGQLLVDPPKPNWISLGGDDHLMEFVLDLLNESQRWIAQASRPGWEIGSLRLLNTIFGL
jgi:hypothetical protein